jgi:hypothetical protein
MNSKEHHESTISNMIPLLTKEQGINPKELDSIEGVKNPVS